ncbi:nucleotide-sugar transporter [Rhizopogon salebrosus TDB-379]|nr:nucleotide-sugar transporter [Rhizopogon salebrosus TDB-379]
MSLPAHQENLALNPKGDHDDIEFEELGLLPADTPPVPSFRGIPLKYISLVTLAVQNSLLTIIMHYSRVSIPPSQSYSAPTAVLLNELLKGSISLVIAFARINRSTPYTSDSPQLPLTASRFWHPTKILLRIRRLGREVFSPDCWKLSIPAILYVIQNNLQYVAATNLEAATFQVSYQMKILSTAAFSVLLLRKQLSASQWLALLFLAVGVGVVQIQTGVSDTSKIASSLLFRGASMNALKGFLAVVAACFTSGLAGVYFEMVLKNSQTDLWIRNVQLSAFSLLPALVPIVLSRPSESGLINSLFANFGAWAWATVGIQVFGGLVTAMVIKYSDNILKGFATSLSIVISFLASVALFDFQITFTFILGSVIVLIATWLYNQPGRNPSPSRLAYAGKN